MIFSPSGEISLKKGSVSMVLPNVNVGTRGKRVGFPIIGLPIGL